MLEISNMDLSISHNCFNFEQKWNKNVYLSDNKINYVSDNISPNLHLSTKEDFELYLQLNLSNKFPNENIINSFVEASRIFNRARLNWFDILPTHILKNELQRLLEPLLVNDLNKSIKYFFFYKETQKLFDLLEFRPEEIKIPENISNKIQNHHLENLNRAPKYTRLNSVTGRLTIESGLNVLNFPKEYRKHLSNNLIECDFNALEPRFILTILNKKIETDDLYNELNYNIFNNSKSRENIKDGVISLLYGSNPELIGFTRNESNKLKEIFGYEYFKENLFNKAKSTNWKYINNFYGKKINIENVEEYKLINYYIQSSAIDLAYKLFLNLVFFCKKNNFNIKPLFLIQDAIYFNGNLTDFQKDSIKQYIKNISPNANFLLKIKQIS